MYEICARTENIHLPASGHFGVSAATGGLADDHDVISFITHSFVEQNPTDAKLNVATEEQKKYDKEYEEFVKQMEVEKEQ